MTAIWRTALALATLGLLLPGSPSPCVAQSGTLACEILDSGLKPDDVQRRPYLDYARECIDLLIEHGTDRYGKLHTPLLVSILDVRTRTCPENPLPLDEAYRVIRRGRRGPSGGNLYLDQPTIRAMKALTTLTGQKRYAEFADRYMAYVMSKLVDEKGFFWWGWHRHYDVYRDVMDGHSGNPHEIHIQEAIWPELWQVNPAAVTCEIEAIWQWHVIDKKTGEVNRHGDGHRGCDFAMSAGEILESFAFLFHKTGDAQWRERTRLVADYHWNHRDAQSGLFPNRPNAGPGRFDGSHFDTTILGFYGRGLLRAAEWTGETMYRERLVSLLDTYARYGYDAQAEAFWASLRLDGQPLRGPRGVGSGYDKYEPHGHIDFWQPYVAGYEAPLAAALVYAQTYEATKNPRLLDTAQKWAESLRRAWPPRAASPEAWYAPYSKGWAPHGTYAEHYGQTVAFLLALHRATGKDEYRQFACQVAQEAVAKLYYQGLLRGHPCKPYYEAVDGVGRLLCALIDLDCTLTNKQTPASAVPNW